MLCQRCGKRNETGTEVCAHCGFRLYSLIEDGVAEADQFQALIGLEEHVLGRIGALEKRIHRSKEEMDLVVNALDFLERNALVNRAGLGVLVGLLRERGLIEAADFSRRWLDRAARNLVELERKELFLGLKDDILSSFKGKNTKRFEDRLARAEDLFFAQESHGALIVLEEALSLDPGNRILSGLLGRCYLEGGELDAARTHLSIALKGEAPHPQGAVESAIRLHLREGDHDAALDLIRKGLKRRPGDPELAAYCSLSEGLRNRWQGCREWASEAARQAEGPAPLYLLSHALLRLGRAPQAEEHLQLLISLHPECEEALLQLALLQMAKGWWRRAEESLDRLSGINPERCSDRLLERFRKMSPTRRKAERILPLHLEAILDMMGSAPRNEARILMGQVEREIG